MSGPPDDDLPRRRYTFWLRVIAFVLALALAAWLVEALVAQLLSAASH